MTTEPAARRTRVSRGRRNRRDFDSNERDGASGCMVDAPSPVSRGLLAASIVAVPLAVTYPLVARLSRGIFAWDYPPLTRSGIVPGDHLVNYYRFALFSDAAAHRVVRLHDPYAFALAGPAHDPPPGSMFGPALRAGSRRAGG